LTPEFLDAELKRIGVYGAGTTSTASTSTTGGGGSNTINIKGNHQ